MTNLVCAPPCHLKVVIIAPDYIDNLHTQISQYWVKFFFLFWSNKVSSSKRDHRINLILGVIIRAKQWIRKLKGPRKKVWGAEKFLQRTVRRAINNSFKEHSKIEWTTIIWPVNEKNGISEKHSAAFDNTNRNSKRKGDPRWVHYDMKTLNWVYVATFWKSSFFFFIFGKAEMHENKPNKKNLLD